MRYQPVLITLCLLLSACGGSATNTPDPIVDPPPPVDRAMLTSTSNNSRFVQAYRDAMNNAAQVTAVRADAEMAADASTPSSSSTYTTTYTQETNVDEHDVVKYDGQYLFIAPAGNGGCCFIATDALPDVAMDIAPLPPANDSQNVRILQTSPQDASAFEVATLPIPEGIFIEGLYHHDQRLSTIGSSAWWGTYGDAFARPEPWANQYTQVDVYDTNDITQPTLVASVGVEGSLVNTRRTEQGIHLITRHSPVIDGYLYYPSTDAEKANNDNLISALNSSDILPQIKLNGVTQTGPSLDQCYFNNPDSENFRPFENFPTITMVTTIDPIAGQISNSFCFVGYSDGIYINEGDLVVTQNYWGSGNDSGVYIHQFSLTGNSHYEGSAKLEGRLYLYGNSDFRISRYGDTLRLITSHWTDDTADNIDHQLYLLDSNAANKELTILGTLPNSQRTTEIGKPNEDLYGVRFVADRAYLVSFERIDPLYVIDMSNPRDPFIAGSLDIPGVSNFLHPITDNVLLGLGQSAERKIKLSLFDVSDITSPQLRQEVIVGSELSWPSSEAEYDRHAFSYLPGESKDRFTLPIAGWDDTLQQHRQQLHLFEVNGKLDPVTTNISSPGFIEANNLNAGEYPSYRNRAIIHDDSVYFINGTRVYSAFWDAPINQLGPQ